MTNKHQQVQNMSKTLWSIFWSTLYITYMGVIFPYFFLYLIISSSRKLSRNKIIVRRELKRSGIPRDLRREIAKSYSNGFRISNMIKYTSIGSSQKGEKNLIKIKID